MKPKRKRSVRGVQTRFSGAYSLVIYLRRSVVLKIGRAGEAKFSRGYYVYTGSGGRNVSARVTRHLRNTKSLKWHVDYLLASSAAEISAVVLWPGASREMECAVNRWLLSAADSKVAMRGFGSSDCRDGCPAHLVFFQHAEPLKHLLGGGGNG